MALLAAEALDLDHRQALHADFLQRLFHIVQLERLDDRFDFLHGPRPSRLSVGPPRRWGRGQGNVAASYPRSDRSFCTCLPSAHANCLNIRHGGNMTYLTSAQMRELER